MVPIGTKVRVTDEVLLSEYGLTEPPFGTVVSNPDPYTCIRIDTDNPRLATGAGDDGWWLLPNEFEVIE